MGGWVGDEGAPSSMGASPESGLSVPLHGALLECRYHLAAHLLVERAHLPVRATLSQEREASETPESLVNKASSHHCALSPSLLLSLYPSHIITTLTVPSTQHRDQHHHPDVSAGSSPSPSTNITCPSAVKLPSITTLTQSHSFAPTNTIFNFAPFFQ